MVVGRNQAKLQAKRNQLGTTAERQKKIHNIPRILHEQRWTWPLDGWRAISRSYDGSKMIINSIGQGEIGTSGVGNSEIESNAVSTDEIASNCVGQGEIGTSGVSTDEIAPNCVGQGEIGTSGVGNSEIENGAVSSSKLNGGLFGPSAGSYGLRVLSGGGSTAASAADHTHSSTSFIQRPKEQRKEILLRRAKLASCEHPNGLREAYERIDLLSEVLLDALSLLLDYGDMTADAREGELEKDKPSTRAYKHMFAVDDGGSQEDYQMMVEGHLDLSGEAPMDKHMRNLGFHSHPHTLEAERRPLRRLA